MEDNFLEAAGLVKYFGKNIIINDLSLKVKKGEVLGFLGENGAGKTTTMRMFTGYITPDSGSIFVCGQDIAKHPLQAKAHFGYLPEGAPLYPDMTPKQFLNFVGQARGISTKELRNSIDKMCELFHLGKVFNQALDTLSKGFKRRVGIAQSLLHDPEILILDEPTDGLDPIQKLEVRDLINKLAQEKTIIISTHILEEVEAVCTRAVILSQGKIVADGSLEELQKEHKSEKLEDIFFSLVKDKKNVS